MQLHPLPRIALVLATAAGLALTGGTSAGAATATVGLGSAEAWAVLAGSTVTNTGPSVLRGNTGVSPGTAVTGFPPGLVLRGSVHAADPEAAGAQADLGTAYSDAAGRGPATAVATELGGRTLTAGVHAGATLEITGALTLDAQGDPSAVFVLQSASTLVTGTASSVRLVGGASGCNVVWVLGSSATLGAASSMVGTVMAQESISTGAGTRVLGRLAARTGAVTLNSTVVTRPTCTTGTSPAPTAPSSATSSPAPSSPAPSSPAGTSTDTPATTAPTGEAGGVTVVAPPATTTTPATTAAGSPTAPGSSTPAGGASSSGASGSGAGGQTPPRQALARTGAEVGTPLTLGLVSVAAGAIALLAARRTPPRGRHQR